MTSISARIFEVFKNLKSDAVPKPPRDKYRGPDKVTIDDVTDEENNENVNISEQDDTDIELDDLSIGRNNKPRKNEKPKSKKKPKIKLPEPFSNYVNTQATGSVCNIVNSRNVHVGNVNVWHVGMGSSTTSSQNASTRGARVDTDADIKKDHLIMLIMEAKIKVTHEYLDYVAKNMNNDWQSFFRSQNYSQGLIDTMLMENATITEARYKLLLDWARNDENGTLGSLATLLWEEGQRQIVKILAVMYKKNLQKKNAQ